MGIFGKKKLLEIEAASQFVLMVSMGVQRDWPEIANELKEYHAGELDDWYANCEFALAVVACQIQAIPNLLPADQASRIREYVMQCISSSELGDNPRETIQEYQDAWDQSLQQSESPLIYGIASVLFDKLGFESQSVGTGDSYIKNPLLLVDLSGKVVTFGGTYWKDITQKYKLVP